METRNLEAHARNNEFGNWGPSADLPRGLGILETRNLEFAREYPGICTLGILESGICGGVSWNLPMRKQGIWKLGSLHGSADPQRGLLNLGNSETRNLEFAEEYPGICTLGNMKSGFWGPSADPRRGTGNSETRNLDFGFPCCKVAPPPPPPSRSGLPLIPPRDLPALVDRGSTAFRTWTSFMIVHVPRYSLRSVGELE